MTPANILSAFAAALAAGDAVSAAALFAPDATYDEPPVHFAGRAAIADFIADFAIHHHDARFNVERLLTGPDGSLAAAEWRWSYINNADNVEREFAGACFLTLHGGLITAWRGFSARLH
jgi:ketosteroid isomerase-like protein